MFYTGTLGSYGQLTGLEALKAPSQSKDTVHTEGVLSVDKVQPGSTFQIAIVMTFDEGWHANANPAGEGLIPTEVVLPEYTNLKFGDVIYPKGDVLEIASIGKAPVYHDRAVIGVQATLGQITQIQKVELPFELTYQACSDEQCLLPKTVSVNIPMEIVGTDQPVQPINEKIFSSLQLDIPQDTPTATSETGEFRKALSRGYFWAFLFVFIGGGFNKPDSMCLSVNSNYSKHIRCESGRKPLKVVFSFSYVRSGYCRNVLNSWSRRRINRRSVWSDNGESNRCRVCKHHPHRTRTFARRCF